MRLYLYINELMGSDYSISEEEDIDKIGEGYREIILESASEINIISDGTGLDEEELY
jgi:hypothetical protein